MRAARGRSTRRARWPGFALPRELIAGWRNGDKRLPAGVAMFCGTMPAIGDIRPAPRFEMELEDPVLGRRLSHAYEVQALPVVA